MDMKQVGALLQGAVPMAETPVDSVLSNESTDPQILAKEASLSSPETMITFPKYYLTRDQQKVVIYGVIQENTVEYNSGFRFFDSAAYMTRGAGMIRLDGEDPDDLAHPVDRNDNHPLASNLPTEKWVHPQHRIIHAFFRGLAPNCTLYKGGHYLNRMGFVVCINKVENAAWDDGGRQYMLSGQRREDSVSMLDLVHEIINWSLFDQSDWTTTQVHMQKSKHIAEEDEGDFMDSFDPNEGNRQMVMAEFFKKVLECSDLAKRLNIEFGFHMNPSPGVSP